MSTYGSSPTKRRRSTKAELADLDALIVAVVEEEYPVTLRGVYYRVVSRGGVPKTEAAYKAVGRRLLALRRSKRIPYHRITDGTRWVRQPQTYDDLEDALTRTAQLYRRNLWRIQPVEVHVYTEKDAISGVVYDVTAQYQVPLGVLRGYCSETFAYSVAESIKATRKPTFVYQLGDHDPSGIGAWEDFRRKVEAFADGCQIAFERLAVTPEQVQSLSLPTRPTKTSDTRAHTFVGGSVEVDAIPAPTLRQIVSDAIEQHIDPRQLRITEQVEESEREILWDLADEKRDRAHGEPID